ncbi:hypothetical protein [Thermogemmatispora sp.]|uniref:hypothetical protein n=1 Tax=Thermogemmatispora sp. TaxID=1968838 RepID=UPI0035E3F4C1
MQQQEQDKQGQQPAPKQADWQGGTWSEGEGNRRRSSFGNLLNRKRGRDRSHWLHQEPPGHYAEPLHDYSYRRGYPAQDYPHREEEESARAVSGSSDAATWPKGTDESGSTAASVQAAGRGGRSSGAEASQPAGFGPGQSWRTVPPPVWSEPPWWARPQPQRGHHLIWIVLGLALLVLLFKLVPWVGGLLLGLLLGGVGLVVGLVGGLIALIVGLLGATIGLIIAVIVAGLLCLLPLAIGGAIVWLLVRGSSNLSGR